MMGNTSRTDDDRHRLPVALIVVTVTLWLLAAGCSGSSASTEDVQTPAANSTPETAKTNSTAVTGGSDDFALVHEVDGRRLFLECRGSGSPTVILQSGFGNAGDIWNLTDTSAPAVFPALAESNRVCIYDRPGTMITTTNAGGAVALGDSALRGRSDPAPMPRDPAEVVAELHDLLAAVDVQEPFVLVGHSLGGALGVLYARTYPDDVSGLVVVDSPLPPNRDLVSPETWENVRVLSLDQSLVPGYQLESYDLGTLFDEIDAVGALQDMPVVVVRRGGPSMGGDPIPEGLPITQADVDALGAAQWNGQATWATGVPGAALITVPDTTHYIQNQRPDAVVAAIRQAIAGT
jgi:pimeloyl-ACP methyl ester carboxylesterase